MDSNCCPYPVKYFERKSIMNKIAISNLVAGNQYRILQNGNAVSVTFKGVRMVGSDVFRDAKFATARNGDRWVFSQDGNEIEFRKGWDTKGNAGLVTGPFENELVRIFNA